MNRSLSIAPGETPRTVPDDYHLQTTRAITLAIRQVKGVQIADFGRDIDQALASLREVLPDDLRIERTSDEPAIVQEKIGDFNRNLIEAVVIVIIVALVFMEWRSALLVAFSIPLTVAMTLGMCHMVGVDLQQVSIAALIIALGLLVDDPVVAGDAINRELAHGQPRDVAAWLGPQKLARAILFATLDQLRGVPAAAAGDRQDRRIHLVVAGRRHRLAGGQSHCVDDVHAATRLLRPEGTEGF